MSSPEAKATPRRWRRPAPAAALLAAAGFAALLSSAGGAEPDPEGPPEAAEILRRAFQQRYEIDVTYEVELRVERDGDEVHRRVLYTAMSGRGEDFRAIGQLVSPPNLRGMTILSVEREGSHQTFVYLPKYDRVRRISVAQEGDPFLASDLTYEDFARQRVSDCAEVDLEPSRVVTEEPTHVVSCTPREAKSYERAVFVIAESDAAILEISYYGSEDEGLVRRISSPRHTVSVDGHPLPTRLRVETPGRGTTTQVTVRNLRSATLPDRLFSASLLGRRRPDLSRLVR